MTSMFESYNKSLQKEMAVVESSNNSLPLSGYITMKKEESSIFLRKKMNLTLFHDISHLKVSNGRMIVVTVNKAIIRLNIKLKEERDDVALEKLIPGYEISQVFLDPLGCHLLISITTKNTSEFLYLHRKSTRPKKLEKFKNFEITAVGFNVENQNENRTSSILLGTSHGLIFETEIIADGDKVSLNNYKQVFHVGGGENCLITGIEFYKIKSTYVILVTTIDRIYKFFGIIEQDDKSFLLQNIFNPYLSSPEDFQLIKSKLKYSMLQVSYQKDTKNARAFGWLTEHGIYYGEIDENSCTPAFIVSNEIIPYPNLDNDFMQKFTKNKDADKPIAFVLTDFHALLLFTDHITAVSILNYEVVFEDVTEQYGKLIGTTTDTTMGSIYVYTSKYIFLYYVNNEERNVWKMYADKNEFELAKKYCKNNPAHMDNVLVKQAEQLFIQKQYNESALIYSRTQSSFEDICLKFLEINKNDALMTYLKNRLIKLEGHDKTQLTMLVVWIIELYLTEIARCADNRSRMSQLQSEYDAFTKIPQVESCMKNNRSVIYDLMASHADSHNLTAVIKRNEDFETVMNQYINQNKFTDALNILKNHNKSDLYYKYCPILMENIPKETITLIINLPNALNVTKLLPTLIIIESDNHVMEIIRYLEYSIYSQGCIDQAIHNYLIKLYGKYNNNEKIRVYLDSQGKDASMVYYDIHYALRVCTEQAMLEACVFLQCLLEMWLPAVELALTFNDKLAQETASMPADKQLKRSLWLKVAEHKIKQKEHVDEAIDLIKECDLLKIEDLLPFFSDFQKIDKFKEVICDALKEYNDKIEEQRKDMEDSAKSAEKVRTELNSFRNRSITISATEQCAICEVYLFLKPFFIFPCGHKFHGDCFEKSLMAIPGLEESEQLIHLKERLLSIGIQHQDARVDKSLEATRRRLKDEIEKILTANCLYCGEIMIENLNQPFTEKRDNVNNGWD